MARDYRDAVVVLTGAGSGIGRGIAIGLASRGARLALVGRRVEPLQETARQVASEVTLAKCAGEGRCLSTQPKVLVGGNGVSGPAFVDNAAFREFTFDTFQAKVLDMESAATAHVAYSNGVPFIAFRSLSDLAGGGEGENEMGTFFALASENSAKVVQAFLAALP